jgi:hypothetical protein
MEPSAVNTRMKHFDPNRVGCEEKDKSVIFDVQLLSANATEKRSGTSSTID